MRTSHRWGRSRRPGAPGQKNRDQRRAPEAKTADVPMTRPEIGAPIRAIELPQTITVKRLAELLEVSPAHLIKQFMDNGVLATVNQTIDHDTAAIVARALGFEVAESSLAPQGAELGKTPPEAPVARDETELLVERAPVVTVMGHVDHGKTSLLDAIRKTNVTAREAGSITQHIGAYQVEVHNRKITFLDTPGHEAFTAMRARGAQTTDIAVIVVAADNGVMPQTVEAIDHARAARVPIIVAINKIDKPEANIERVKQQLSELGLVPEDWGGDTVLVPVSAKKHTGIEHLLEMVLLVADMAELKANPNRPGTGVVIEAKLEKTRGPVATVLVQQGTVKVGDFAVGGSTYGRVKAMRNDKGKPLKKADPATPAEVLGLADVPEAGDSFEVVPDEKTAKSIAAQRQETARLPGKELTRGMTLEDLYHQVAAGEVKELNLILKTDVQGSIEPIKSSLERLSSADLRIRFLHIDTGSITESDVLLATASQAIIIGFNTRVEPGARKAAETSKVDIRLYDVIYGLLDDIGKALMGLKEPVYQEMTDGHAEVRELFHSAKGLPILGISVRDGRVRRNDLARVYRDGGKVYEGKVVSLRRFKEDAREVTAGMECGVGLDEFKEPQIGDIVEFYYKEPIIQA